MSDEHTSRKAASGHRLAAEPLVFRQMFAPAPYDERAVGLPSSLAAGNPWHGDYPAPLLFAPPSRGTAWQWINPAVGPHHSFIFGDRRYPAHKRSTTRATGRRRLLVMDSGGARPVEPEAGTVGDQLRPTGRGISTWA